ncbi:MAG: hypothetical protein CO135_01140 [Candidatus Levybacteria bacterium CG_4_9_14_3_um_filter_35_16]|nr:MAG: hypothetical protein COW87_03075 [Candidatus Levybacteria bacterium CG22_combo_CG10-13_8_21_14_all_35_11]PIZ99598.1 MAG: hypothetical protein COX78_01705 [Candidatus Levybacteria bacterium CG_4_10_14_0_2_um_filter_35_8]PJA91471.1 MAG: hypothetical protein CO135_01140 [Candidatus Levybacteria bacterium CG_4_9_14_3_um_filter_35_16]PJC54690.1 MAG: hypothetical protein CO028_00985 [Candidatus Levybacteria bacterium CG_4_9_14_0_2_um_filter_35_21]
MQELLVSKIYDWKKENNFGTDFKSVSLEARRQLLISENILDKDINAETIDEDPLIQSKTLLMFIKALSSSVLPFLTHEDNVSNRTIGLDDENNPAITYGLHDFEGRREYGLFYSSINSDSIPITQSLLKALLIGEELPDGVEKDELTVLKFGSKSKKDVLNSFVKIVKNSL